MGTANGIYVVRGSEDGNLGAYTTLRKAWQAAFTYCKGEGRFDKIMDNSTREVSCRVWADEKRTKLDKKMVTTFEQWSRLMRKHDRHGTKSTYYELEGFEAGDDCGDSWSVTAEIQWMRVNNWGCV